MLFMLLLNSVQSLTVLTFCAQWMALAALLLLITVGLIERNVPVSQLIQDSLLCLELHLTRYTMQGSNIALK